MGKYEEKDGVWRTVGGRRIFIKDGEDLATAMKNSGKFKSASKKNKDTFRNDTPEKAKARLDEARREQQRQQDEFDKKVKEVNDGLKEKQNVEKQVNYIEKMSGLKIEKSFETDLYGNGKEDRFELSDGRIISHTTEALGKETDKWSISKFENGSMNSKTFDNYNQMINHLSRGEQGYGTSYKKYFDEHPNATFEDFEKDYMKKIKGSK